MSSAVTIVVSVLPIITSAWMGYVIKKAERRLEKQSAEAEALKLLMKRELREIRDKYVPLGEISEDDFVDAEQVYNVYHTLGGNSRGTYWFEQIQKLRRV